jgi:acyl-CoA reductase-like NAD-dependent aldehyde dehydrogenase
MTGEKPFLNYIAGEWLEGETTSRNINPSDTRDVIGEYARASRAQVETATAAAAAAQPRWAGTSPQQRADALDTIGHEILMRRQELADLLAREEGKTLPEAAGEVLRAAQIFKLFAGEALLPGGELIGSTRPGIHDRFVAALLQRLKDLKVGDARRTGTDMGPVVDESQLAQDLKYIAYGRCEGARLAFGGEHLPSVDRQPGFYLQPTLFVDTTNDMRINREPTKRSQRPTTPISGSPQGSLPNPCTGPMRSSATCRPAW